MLRPGRVGREPPQSPRPQAVVPCSRPRRAASGAIQVSRRCDARPARNNRLTIAGGLDPSLLSPINSVERLPLGSERSIMDPNRSFAGGSVNEGYGLETGGGRPQLVSVSEKAYPRADPVDSQRQPRRRRADQADSQPGSIDPVTLSEKIPFAGEKGRQSPLKLSPRAAAATQQRSPPRYNPTDSLFGGSSVSSSGAGGDTSPHVSPRRHGPASEKRSSGRLMFS